MIRQGDKVEVGSRVRFTRWDGVDVHDTVRGFFWQHVLREPYARNEWVLGVTLTEHSWVRADKVLPPTE